MRCGEQGQGRGKTPPNSTTGECTSHGRLCQGSLRGFLREQRFDCSQQLRDITCGSLPDLVQIDSVVGVDEMVTHPVKASTKRAASAMSSKDDSSRRMDRPLFGEKCLSGAEYLLAAHPVLAALQGTPGNEVHVPL
jgi:hypothetical protein